MEDTIEIPRPRILLMAFECSPDHGSEWANGWNRAIECAKRFDTWVVCQGDRQAAEIGRYLDKQGPIPRLHFEFVSYVAGGDTAAHVSGLKWLKYNLWQRKAYRVAYRLHEELHFDLVHHVTNTGYREPGYAWKLDAPLVWGPIGGTHNYPWRFIGEAGFRYGLGEAVRSVLNSVQLNCSRRPRIASRRASARLAANSTMQQQASQVLGRGWQSMIDVGISSVAGPQLAADTQSPGLRILWSGQFAPRKALSLLLKALARMPRDLDFELRAIGGGPMERRWKRLAQDAGIADRVTWPGWLSHEQSLAQYAWANVFAFTSLRDNSGTVVLEALGAGLPVVCLDHQGARDMVTDECGFKIAVESPRQVVDDLADVLTRLARDPALAANMRDAAIARARDYLWTAQGVQMTEIYRRVIEQDHHAAPSRAASTRPAIDSATDANGNGCPPSDEAEVDDRAAVIPRSRLREVATWAAERAAVCLHKLGPSRVDEGFGILMYHRVADRTRGVESPTNNVTPKRLRAQLEGLLARGFEAWPLRRALQAHAEKRRVPSNAFVVTFDDGYENNYVTALPILKELGVPATVFLATAFLDSDRPFPCDDWKCAGSSRVPSDSWRPLSTAQCQAMLDSGLIELGAHTHTHRFFLGRIDVFRRDMARCIEVLKQRFGITRPSFAFPFGMFSPELVEVAGESGVTCALSTRSERVAAHSEPFTWGRFAADNSDTAATLAAKLSGWYTPIADVLRGWKRRVAAIAPGSRGFLEPLGRELGSLAPKQSGSGCRAARSSGLTD